MTPTPIDTAKIANEVTIASYNCFGMTAFNDQVKQILDRELGYGSSPATIIGRSEFPAPPEEEEWHNPDNLTPEQVGTADGWRLALKSEVENRLLTGKCELWNLADWDGSHHWVGDESHYTYRTREPLPETDPLAEQKQWFAEDGGIDFRPAFEDWRTIRDPDWHLAPIHYRRAQKPQMQEVPLEASDIVPGSVVRSKENPDYVHMVIGWDLGGIYLNSEYVHFCQLKDYSEIRRPTDTEWKACSKFVEVAE